MRPQQYPLTVHPAEADSGPLTSEILRSPGGKYLLPHLMDGPYHLMLLSSYEDHLQAHVISQAFPMLEVLYHDGMGQIPSYLVVVPAMVADFLTWYMDEDTYFAEDLGRLGVLWSAAQLAILVEDNQIEHVVAAPQEVR